MAEKYRVIGYYKGHVNHLKNMHHIVLLRHGESVWNRENRFTGWADAGLTEAGCEKALATRHRLKTGGFDFDQTHPSALKRAIKTWRLALELMDVKYLSKVIEADCVRPELARGIRPVHELEFSMKPLRPCDPGPPQAAPARGDLS